MKWAADWPIRDRRTRHIDGRVFPTDPSANGTSALEQALGNARAAANLAEAIVVSDPEGLPWHVGVSLSIRFVTC